MSDFRLDDGTHDLMMVGYDFVLVDSTDELRQRLLILLKMYQGELFYNTDFGTPYYQRVLGKQQDLVVVEAALKATILSSTAVKKLLEFTLDYVPASRSLTVSFKVQLYDDTELVVNEVVL